MIFPVAVPLGPTVYTKLLGLIVAVPSQPGKQLAFVVEVTVGAAGGGGVVTVTVVVFEQPFASVPVTIYTVPAHNPLIKLPTMRPAAGEIVYTKLFGLIRSVPSQPGKQVAGVVKDVGGSGKDDAVTVTVVVLEQPLASVPVTV